MKSTPNHPACFSGYLRYAIDSDFAYFKARAHAVLPLTLLLLVHLSPQRSRDAELRFFNALRQRGARFRPTERLSDFVTVQAPESAFRGAFDASKICSCRNGTPVSFKKAKTFRP